MYVKDYMTKEVVTIMPETTIIQALDIMREHDIRRLPVVQEGKLLGLLTDTVIDKHSPSTATSLSVHELNYLLNKTTAKDIMIKKPRTIQPDALLEHAAAVMRQEGLGSLVVMAGEELVGIITDKDIFDAFINISGYNSPGVRIGVEIDHDHTGILLELGRLFHESDVNIWQIAVYRQPNHIQLVFHVDSQDEIATRQLLEQAGYRVVSVFKKQN